MSYVPSNGLGQDILSGAKSFFSGVQQTAKEGVKVKTDVNVKLATPILYAVFGGLGLVAYYLFTKK